MRRAALRIYICGQQGRAWHFPRSHAVFRLRSFRSMGRMARLNIKRGKVLSLTTSAKDKTVLSDAVQRIGTGCACAQDVSNPFVEAFALLDK